MLYRFAHCVLDTQLHTLCRAGQSALLSPKVFEVLCYLIAHRAQVVSKQELCEQVWQGLAISDATLESCVRAVRTSVGDSGQAQQIIQTQRGYGYRFVAAVDTLPESPPEPAAGTAAPAALQPDNAAQEQAQTAPPLSGTRPCGFCTSANREDATFCAACGTRLRQRCASCGQDVALPAAFCVACGQPLTLLPHLTPVSTVTASLTAAASTTPRQAGLSTERKPVTVLCCTVATLAAHDARVDLDALHSLMQALDDLAREVVQQYGGWLQPVMGDRLLVTFGVPVVQEDHARRAVRVALALRQRGHELRERLGAGPGLALRMGLHTGLVVESRWDDAASAVAVVGDVISLAVALQAQAEPGQILCSDATAHLVRETVRLEAVGLLQVAEQPSPVAAYAVLGSSAQRAPGGQYRERGLSPFVGREREMTTLHALLTQVEAGRGQVVGVVGEAGIGKSRLVSEFSQSLEGRPLTYLTGHCLSYGSATPYLPLLDLLRHHCDITEAAAPEDITARVQRSLQEVGMSPETWAPVFLPLLGVQEGANQLAALSPEARKARILTAFTELCLNGSRARALVLEIEDLHWIDASSEECLAAIVERMAGVPLLLLVTSRPGYRPAWIDKSYVTQVALQPLSSQESLRVVQAVLPTAGLSAPAVSHLLAKAEGNPFFLEELARMVVEQGADASAVPDTVQAVLMARIDRLPASARRLLQTAAVIGKDVALPLLQAVTARPEAAMYSDLRSLQAAEFLYETYVHAAPVYTFKHVLTQEVAYQSLVRRTRQQYHERIAQVLEEQFPEVVETQPELLAQHYTEAARGAPAIPYWQRAGQRAVERSANVEAISHFSQGLELLQALPDTPQRVQQELTLQLAMGSPLLMLKGHTAPEVAHAYTRAYTLAQQLGETPQRFAVLVGLWRFYLSQAQFPTARELAEQCFVLAQYLGEPASLQEAHTNVGSTFFFMGDPAAAQTHLEQGLALYEPQQSRHLAFSRGTDPGVVCLARMAWALWWLGYPERALARSHEAIALARQLTYPYSLVFALQYNAILHMWRRETGLVKERAEAAMVLMQEHGLVNFFGGAMVRLGWVLVEEGAVAEGLAQIRRALDIHGIHGIKLGLHENLAILAQAYGRAGQAEDGLRVLADAMAAVHNNAECYCEAELYRLQGELLLQSGMAGAQEAEACLRQALTIARHQRARSLELRAVMSLAQLWQRQGKRAEARHMLAEIYGWFTEGFDTLDLQEAQALLEALQ